MDKLAEIQQLIDTGNNYMLQASKNINTARNILIKYINEQYIGKPYKLLGYTFIPEKIEYIGFDGWTDKYYIKAVGTQIFHNKHDQFPTEYAAIKNHTEDIKINYDCIPKSTHNDEIYQEHWKMIISDILPDMSDSNGNGLPYSSRVAYVEDGQIKIGSSIGYDRNTKMFKISISGMDGETIIYKKGSELTKF